MKINQLYVILKTLHTYLSAYEIAIAKADMIVNDNDDWVGADAVPTRLDDEGAKASSLVNPTVLDDWMEPLTNNEDDIGIITYNVSIDSLGETMQIVYISQIRPTLVRRAKISHPQV